MMSYRTRRRNPRVCGYELGAELGYGAFGRVVYATHVETGNEVAVKIISKRRSEVVNVMARREINILRSVSHEHIVRLEDSFEDDSHFYLVFELCKGQSLHERLKSVTRFSEYEVQTVMRICFEVVHYLHDRGIVHRDIKPQNIILRDERYESVVLADFGVSRAMGSKGDLLRTRIGTRNYMAPEVFTSKGYTNLADIWSMGVLMHYLLGGDLPWTAPRVSTLMWYRLLKSHPPKFMEEQWGQVSAQAKDLIKKCLAFRPDERITAEQALQHPWLSTLKAPRHNLVSTDSECMTVGSSDGKLRSLHSTPSRKLRRAAMVIWAVGQFRGIVSKKPQPRVGPESNSATSVPLKLEVIAEKVEPDSRGYGRKGPVVSSTHSGGGNSSSSSSSSRGEDGSPIRISRYNYLDRLYSLIRSRFSSPTPERALLVTTTVAPVAVSPAGNHVNDSVDNNGNNTGNGGDGGLLRRKTPDPNNAAAAAAAAIVIPTNPA